MSKAPPPITDKEIQEWLSSLVDDDLELLLEDIGVEDGETKPQFFSYIENVQQSAESLVRARSQTEASSIEAAYLRLNTAVESVEKWAKSIPQPELVDVARMLLLEAYTLHVIATSQDKINLVSAQHKAKERFNDKGKPPENFMDPDRW